jgi:integrase
MATIPAVRSVRAPALYLGTLAPGSRPAVFWRLEKARALLGVVGLVDWSSVCYADLVELRARAAEAYAPRTAAAILNTFRAVCRQAWLSGAMSGDTFRRIEALPGITGSSAPVGRYVTRPELRALFEAAREGNAPGRDVALLALLFGAGLRRSEASALTVDDVSSGWVVVGAGKGRKGRRVPVAGETVEALEAWRSELEGGAYLRRVLKSGRTLEGALGGEGIRRRLVALCRAAMVDVVRPHDARRTYCSHLLDAGVDISTVAGLMGHASVQVTAGYDRRGERAGQEAAALVRLPVSSRAGLAGHGGLDLEEAPAPATASSAQSEE